MGSLLLPVKVECFIFNKSVCSGADDEAKIAPLAQPDYALLQYNNHFLSNDVLRHVDLHAASPASTNMRFTDLGTNQPRSRRQGVYVHWTLPRPYRTAATKTEPKAQAGLPPDTDIPGDEKYGESRPSDGHDPTVPSYYDVPPRWLVVRHIDDRKSIQPESAEGLVPEFRAWVVESDVCRSIDDLDESVDVQTDVSPYIAPESGLGGSVDVDMQAQSEVFIGQRFPAETWCEKNDTKRVRLNLFNSSNQLFADYQPHNGNVFSMLDRFEYLDSAGKEQCLEAANASYYVIGWQPDIERDLFVPPTGQKSDDPSARPSQLQSLNMILEADDLTNAWSKDHSAARTLCHGAMYEVEWNALKKPSKVPADQTCSHLMKASPIAVGTTPMDAIMAYVSGHSKSSVGDVHKLEMDLLKLQTLLLDRDEGVEPQRRAANVLSNFNFQRQDGGRKYFLSNPQDGDNKTTKPEGTYEPTETELSNLSLMNEKQRQIDTLSRLLRKRQWDLFALWWKLLIDVNAAATSGQYKKWREEITKHIGNIHRKIKAIENEVDKVELDSKIIQVGTSEPFHQAGDPTVLLAGIQSGWPVDFLDPLKVRLRHQIIGARKDGKPVEPNLPENLGTIIKNLEGSWGTENPWGTDMRLLLSEFIILNSDINQEHKPENPALLPLYHDVDRRLISPEDDKPSETGDPKKPDVPRWRDRWHGTQPWLPLYLEWEVNFIQIPYNHWELDDGDLTRNEAEYSKLRYRIKTESLSKDDVRDSRKLSGRVLMLPQPTMSLKHKVEQLFTDTPAPMLKGLEDDLDFILSNIDKLNLLSAPLAGFTDHLITRQGGTHVKPTYRQPNRSGGGGYLPKAIPGAKVAAKHGEFGEADLILMGLETDLTPYGAGVSFSADGENPFKPVTHGQFCFSKLNIIDKFGQAVHAISPSISGDKTTPKLYTSEYLRAQQLLQLSTSNATPVGGRGDSSVVRSEFAQVPPQINQLARLNADFVTLQPGPGGPSSKPYWKPVQQAGQPVWGWVMVNYANYGLQFFASDGRFYKEVRFGGPDGSMTSPNWMPDRTGLEPDKDPGLKQLDNLLETLKDKDYLMAFIYMINGAMKHMLPAPGAFSEFSTAIVGQPLALVNMGWSLELAVEAYESHASFGPSTMRRTLTQDEKDKKPRKGDNNDNHVYAFRVKLGDKTKAYDGLVGYWNAKESPVAGDGLELRELFTYYIDETEDTGLMNDPRTKISHTNFPKFNPYYLDPTELRPLDHDVQHCRQLQGFGAIIDPFTAIHGYSSILPVRELKLSPWMWEKAFRNMTAFFHMGPLIVTTDLVIPTGAVAPAVDVESPATKEKPEPLKVKLPTNSLAQWEWLQPYMVDNEAFPESVHVASFGVAPADQKPRLEPNPYTAIEGYLHLKGPSVVKDVSKTPERNS
ncbi:hypothetical protein TGAM01_v206831 [Trichoderma gamsii]|uniref:Uncharacterized protein n=1 Tax=Trichoderma gamsii TaxID=398673 RepID=A0A2P4ZIP8_9HYPO|nr:hypothetical protein TGAM01_v206831 [Trichoderma gamsii]PON24143.1 hypothetical protein TGAM01_v206831 [Trichoderma gamsii]